MELRLCTLVEVYVSFIRMAGLGAVFNTKSWVVSYDVLVDYCSFYTNLLIIGDLSCMGTMGELTTLIFTCLELSAMIFTPRF